MGLLILGLGGFGVTNFGGTIRSIATVGEIEVGVNDYARALDREMRSLTQQLGQPVTMDQLQAFGRDAQVRAALITGAALEDEAARIGISVGDEEVARQITGAAQFQGLNGAFDRESYAFSLRQQGLTEAEFEDRLRAETARTILEGAVVGGVVAPQAQVAALVGWALERRAFSHAELIAADLAEPVPDPTADQLAAYHQENIARYTRPEIRQMSYAWLSPESLTENLEIDETTLRAAYEERIGDYVQPERRIVERLVFPSAEEAAAALARIEAGETDFAAVVEARGLTLSDIDLGDVTREDLGAGADPVFATAEPGVVGPVETPLGPALFNVNAILAAEEVPFEAARDELGQEVAIDRARRLLLDQAGGIEDLLAGGATLEDLADEAGMTFGTIEMAPDTREGIAAYTAFREAAFAAAEGDFPELFELEDGGLAALRLDAVLPPAPQPLDEVRDRVTADWRATETQARLEALGAEITAQLDAGATMEGLGLVLTRHPASTRDAFFADLPPAALEAVFATGPGGHAVVTENGVHILRTDAVEAVEADDAEAAALTASVSAQLERALADDLFAAYATALQAEAGITLNGAAIEAVHAQLR
jgi:peptidyl-prolyl cis-trans isomerase D